MEQQQTMIDEDQELALHLQRQLVPNSPMPAQCCIFRIPSSFRRQNEHLFEPSLVSIGPYHRVQNKLQPMKKLKLWYLNCLIARAPTPDTSLECFIKSIKPNVKHCLDCYAEKVDFSEDKFVEMMVIDGCFIIELLRKWAKMIPISADDPLFKMPWMRKALVVDLLLLENQLPWFVLDCLFDLTRTNCDDGRFSLPQLAHYFFHFETLRFEEIRVDLTLINKHLLDLQRNIILSTNVDVETTETVSFNAPPKRPLYRVGSEITKYDFKRLQAVTVIPRVTELLQAGVDFEVGKETDLMKIEFKNGVLKIPPIVVVDNAESFFRNLIAYEQCDCRLNDKISSYARFLDNLIKSQEDLDYLNPKGIITYFLSTEYVSSFFNRLYNDADIAHYSYVNVSGKVNAYCQTYWPRNRAKLLRDYFSNPWSTISLFGVILILVLTFTQTYYSASQH